MSRWVWFAIGLVALAAGGLVLWAGLENADKIASVIGAAAGVLGLGLSLRSLKPVSGSSGPSVSDSTINGPNIQIGSADGDVDVR